MSAPRISSLTCHSPWIGSTSDFVIRRNDGFAQGSMFLFIACHVLIMLTALMAVISKMEQSEFLDAGCDDSQTQSDHNDALERRTASQAGD